tara:strand:- start:541 stop:741 length:201 start_codon:yes stop_codon:yes gene_type:complete
MYKSVIKYGRVVEILEKEIAILKKDSHPPVIDRKEYKELQDDVVILKAFIDNVEKISTDYMKDIAN